MPNVVNLLKQDHRAVEKLFSDFQEGRDRSVAEEICNELDLHMRFEEEIVYPVLQSDVPDGEGMAEHAEEEHKEARQLVGRVRETESAGRLDELIQELQSAIEEHVTEEENEVFPKLEQSLRADRLEQMGTELEAQRT